MTLGLNRIPIGMVNVKNDESALVERAKQDQDAFGELYERYVDRIYNYLYYRTGNVHDAEDLTARVFVRAVRHIGNYEDRGAPFSAWLYSIARNMLSNWYRDHSKRKVLPLDNIIQLSGGESPERRTEQSEDRDELIAAIRRLPADRQELLILKYVEQLPNAEIGQIMGRSEGAIKALYHRTLISLRDDIDARANQIAEERSYSTGRWRFGKRRRLRLRDRAHIEIDKEQVEPLSAKNGAE